MARSRNIKPSFFTNDELADIDPLGRLLFIGLWTIADCNGNLEWKPRRIKAQLLPYDECDVEKLAINLDKSRFIRFYSDGDFLYVNVVNFCTHQNPHKNERDRGSNIPKYTKEMRQVIDFKGLTINLDKSRLKRKYSASDPADSLNLIPDSLNVVSERKLTSNRSTSKKPKINFDSWPNAPDQKILNDWLTVRKAKRAPLTQTAVDRMARELHTALEAGYTVDDCIGLCCKQGWQGFKFDWLQNHMATNGGIINGKPNPFADDDTDWMHPETRERVIQATNGGQTGLATCIPGRIGDYGGQEPMADGADGSGD